MFPGAMTVLCKGGTGSHLRLTKHCTGREELRDHLGSMVTGTPEARHAPDGPHSEDCFSLSPYRRAIFRNNKSAHTFLQGQGEGRGAGVSAEEEGGPLSSPNSALVFRGFFSGASLASPASPAPTCPLGFPSSSYVCPSASELVLVLTRPSLFLILPLSPSPRGLGNSWDGPSSDERAKYSHRTKQREAVGHTHAAEHRYREVTGHRERRPSTQGG